MSSPSTSSRNVRKTLLGFVTSRSGAKSVKVTIPYKTPHPLYHKVINRKTVVHVHDEKDETKVGDKVEIMETRPLSRLKRWRVISVVERSVGDTAQAISETDVAAQVPTKTTKVDSAPSSAPLRGATAGHGSANDQSAS
jgi:small subunit ribosomal protein S17